MAVDEPEVVDIEPPVLTAESRVLDMRARLRELGAPIYGDKPTVWRRLKAAEEREIRESEIREAYQRQREAEYQSAEAGERQPPPREPAVPGEPSDLVKKAHYLTHLPPAPWCAICIRGRGPVTAHQSIDWQHRAQGPPLTQIDFAYMKSDGNWDRNASGAWATTLVAADKHSGCVFAHTVESKQKSNEYMHKSLIAWISTYLRHQRIRLQSDGEPAVRAVCQYVVLKRGETKVQTDTITRVSPAHSSGSLGLAEAAIRRVQNQARVLRLDIARRYGGLDLHPEHIGWPWLIRHSAWLLDHFSVRKSGRTPFMQLNDAAYRGEILEKEMLPRQERADRRETSTINVGPAATEASFKKPGRNKGVGLDGIPAEVLCAGEGATAVTYSQINEHVAETGQRPYDWQGGEVVNLFK